MYKTPTLKCDSWRTEPLPTRCKLERRVVWALLQEAEKAGFKAVLVDDVDGESEDGWVRVDGAKAAMEEIFAVDERTVCFSKSGARAGSIFIMLGIPEEVVCDWGWKKTELGQAFNTFMEGFKAEDWI